METLRSILPASLAIALAAMVAASGCGEATTDPADAPGGEAIESPASGQSSDAGRAAEPAATAQPARGDEGAAPATAQPARGDEGAAPEGLPPYIAILSAPYHEAYFLLPKGEGAERVIAGAFGDFDAAAMADDTPPPVISGESPPMDRATEFELLRALRDDASGAWLEERVSEFAPDVGQHFKSTKDVDARLDILRTLYEGGKDVEVRALGVEWSARMDGTFSEEAVKREVARFVRIQEETDALWRMSPRQRTISANESRVCGLIAQLVVGGDPNARALFKGCDIAAALDDAKRALEASGGRYPFTDAELAEWAEDTPSFEEEPAFSFDE